MPRRPSDHARGSHRIAATPPVFPSYLLPSLRFPFLRRVSSSSSPSSGPSAPGTCPAAASRLARLAPDTIRCTACSADLALSSQIISKGFTGRHGRALLVAPRAPDPPRAGDADDKGGDGRDGGPAEGSLLNMRMGRCENRQLVTGWHVVADISCGACGKKLGWKYVDAKEKSQKYKVGKFILETERVMTHRSWEDVGRGGGGGGEGEAADEEDGAAARQDADRISFDSDDEDECDDVFAGTWDARLVAQRRARMAAARSAAQV